MALTGRGVLEGRRVLLVKPQTYMNRSGESVGAL
ncbi:MAG: aminoacyl-tRNA hydrolase, partial [Clostridiales bacterium]|nr:aminoacyl-tRNA hydrolase [Clostridiales bacterium]